MTSIIRDIGVELEGYVPKYVLGHKTKDDDVLVRESIYDMKKFMTVPSRLTGSNEYTIHIKDFPKSPDKVKPVRKSKYISWEWKYYGNYQDLEQFLKVMYNQYKFSANNSCGFHMHLNISKDDYPLIVTKQFYDSFVDAYKKKFAKVPKYINRLDKSKCGWCTPDYEYFIDGSRNVFTMPIRHKTFEVRVMPYMRNYKEAMGAIKWVNDTFDDIYNDMCDIPAFWKDGEEALKVINNCGLHLLCEK
jgi:hypothetical protein